MEVTVSNTSNGGTVSDLLYQIQAISRLAVSNFLSRCCIKYKQLSRWLWRCLWAMKSVRKSKKRIGGEYDMIQIRNKTKQLREGQKENNDGGRHYQWQWHRDWPGRWQ